MKKKSFAVLLVWGILCFTNTHCFAFKKAKAIEELKQARLYVHLLNFKEAQAIYVQFPDAGEMLIIGGDKEISFSVIAYLKHQFVSKKGKFVSGLRSFLGWKHHLDIMVNTYLSSSSINDLLSLFREMDISTLLSSLSKDVPFTKSSFPEIERFTYLIRNYPGYSSIKRGDYIPTPIQQRVNITLEVLSPANVLSFKDYLENFKDKEWLENNVLILKLTFNQVSILFPSFIGEEAQKNLIQTCKEKLPSSILILPEGKTLIHSFLEKVNPEIIEDRDIVIITDGEKVYLKNLKKIEVETEKEKEVSLKETPPKYESLELEKKAEQERRLQQERIAEQQKRLEEQKRAEEEIRERERRLDEQRRREEEKRLEEEKRRWEYGGYQ